MRIRRGGFLTDQPHTGNWGYSAGTSGTLAMSGGKRVLGIYATALTSGSLTINGGDTVSIPGGAINIAPRGTLIDPTIVFTGTNAYFVEYVAS
ncbi:MAG: hypothetical protein ACU843_15490 [Gammaproteobacteria bacterium]